MGAALIFLFASSYAILLDSMLNEHLRWNYAYDLAGSMVGSISALLLLPRLGAENTFLAILFLSALLIVLCARGRLIQLTGFALAAMSLWACLAGLRYDRFDLLKLAHSGFIARKLERSGVDGPIRGQQIVRSQAAKILDSRWSYFSRVDAIEIPNLFNAKEPQKAVCLFYNDRLWSCSGMAPSWLGYLNHLAMGSKSALIIGVGGGDDFLPFEAAHLQDISGVEINDATIHMLRGPLNGIPHNVYRKYPIAHSDGRSFIESSERLYDTILLRNADLYQPLGGDLFLESYLYTKEAIKKYWDHLPPEGRLIIARVIVADEQHSFDTLNILSTLREFLEERKLSMDRHLTLSIFPVTSTTGYFRYDVLFVLNKPEIGENQITEEKKWLAANGEGKLLGPATNPMGKADASLPKSDAQVQHCLERFYSGESLEDAGCPLKAAGTIRDDHPYFSAGAPVEVLKLFLSPSTLFVLALLLLLGFSYHIMDPGCRLDGRWDARMKIVSLGLISGFAQPFYYHHFLIYAKAPLTTLTIAQFGSLFTSFASSLFFPKVSLAWKRGLLLISFFAISITHFYRRICTDLSSLTSLPFDLWVFIFVSMMAVGVGLLFPHFAIGRTEDKKRDRLFLFGWSFIFMALGAMGSLFTDFAIGLNASFGVLAVTTVFLFTKLRQPVLPR